MPSSIPERNGRGLQECVVKLSELGRYHQLQRLLIGRFCAAVKAVPFSRSRYGGCSPQEAGPLDPFAVVDTKIEAQIVPRRAVAERSSVITRSIVKVTEDQGRSRHMKDRNFQAKYPAKDHNGKCEGLNPTACSSAL